MSYLARLVIVTCYAKYLVTTYCALTAGKVIVIIIIDRYVYRLYWYVEAYSVTSPIVYRRLSWCSG